LLESLALNSQCLKLASKIRFPNQRTQEGRSELLSRGGSSTTSALQEQRDTISALKLKQAELNQKAIIISEHSEFAKQEQMKQFLDHMKAAGRTDDVCYQEINEMYLNSLYEQAKRPISSIIDLVNERDTCPSSFKRMKVKNEHSGGVKSELKAAASPTI
jgi:hypothetical protein